MEIIFKGRQTDVPVRFREYAIAKLSKLEKLDAKAIRVDVEVSVERNPRQASQKERVELTVRSRGPAIRAEAAAEDRLAALDLAIAKLDSRLRRALDRRKSHHGGHAPDWRQAEPMALADGAGPLVLAQDGEAAAGEAVSGAGPGGDSVVPIDMEGDGPLVVRQKFHHASPISIDQALLEMELVGHDFYLFHDLEKDVPSVVYRRRGYQYGVIRLLEGPSGSGDPVTEGEVPASGGAERGTEVPRRRSEPPGDDGSDLAGQGSRASATM